MTTPYDATMQRRLFLKFLGMFAASSGLSFSALAAPGKGIAIVTDPEDSVASSEPGVWAVGQLETALTAKGYRVEKLQTLSLGADIERVILIAGPQSKLARGFSAPSHPLPAEGIRIVQGSVQRRPALLVSAEDVRGHVYGLLELADQVDFPSGTAAPLGMSAPLEEVPANQVRSIARLFVSEVEDKSWFYDREFWNRYLDVLARSRFNRFNMTFGLAYNLPVGVTDDYFHLPYPYLLDVPGYHVRVMSLAEGERERNLSTLQFIAAETARRGLQFQLGLWTHAYQWTRSPHAAHRIEGLTPETHAEYCRDALYLLLQSCPQIQGLTLRVHGESGIPEGSYSFWETLFSRIHECGRKVEIEMHAKGVDQRMIDVALATGMPVKLSPKITAEQMGLGYQQADIRELEWPVDDSKGAPKDKMLSLSEGSRRFLRYGYGDLYQEGKKFEILYRLWPGTQRHLLWGDPATASAYGHSSHFCGAAGLEIFEPLTFKGREGSGLPGGRCAYADHSLDPRGGDWQKFEYTYRVWGQMLYNPDSTSDIRRRFLARDFGKAAEQVETTLASASRILPLVTTAHLPSASNRELWVELGSNMPIMEGSEPSPYSDTPAPKVFSHVSPLDPQLFSTVAEHAGDLLQKRVSAKYSPLEVAQWIEDLSSQSMAALESARRLTSTSTPEFRRLEEDVLIVNGLGRFYVAKFRSAFLFEIYKQTGHQGTGTAAFDAYTKARDAWAGMAERAKKVYVANITYGDDPIRRGDWAERVGAIDRDLAALRAALQEPAKASVYPTAEADRMVRLAHERPHRWSVECEHTPPASFSPGSALALGLRTSKSNEAPQSISLCYRHVNHAERWIRVPMRSQHIAWEASIPEQYTGSPYPLQYYFELQHTSGSSCFYPAFNKLLSNQPYFVISKRT